MAAAERVRAPVPAHFKSHAQYIAAAPAPARALLRRIGSVVATAVPAAVPCISYNMPAYRLERVFFYFAAFKGHVGVYPPVMDDAALVRDLAAFRNAKGNLRFDYGEALPDDLIGRVAAALALQYACGKGEAPVRKASKPAPRRAAGGDRAAPTIAIAGYSGTPLAQKLGIKAAHRVHWVRAPASFPALLAPLPDGVVLQRSAHATTDIAHVFAVDQTDLARRLATLRKKLSPQAVLWISWPKRASGVPTSITEDVVRALALPLGWVDVKVCAIDGVWSALKLVVRKSLR